mmetsp:Transcript_20300/g.31751  ORF Transcript_20300/g.31751 Transcript_20300/m.31751 type:complete len:158 (-) Transcript_20300:8-481(-)
MPMSSNKVRVGAAVAALVSVVFVGNASAFAPSLTSSSKVVAQPLFMQRREVVDMFTKVTVGVGVATLVGSTQEANALDMDSFEKSLIDKDTTDCDPNSDRKCTPKLTADEALCKYGVPGSESRGAACRRVRDAGGILPGAKKGERDIKGWVDNPIAL